MMQSQKRQQKVCWNCEGAVSTEALYCPYCGSDMQAHVETNQDMQQEFPEEPLQFGMQSQHGVSKEASNLASLYKPPYSPNHRGFGVPNFKEEQSPQEDFYNPQEQVIYQNRQESSSIEGEVSQKTDAGLWPLLFLSIGMNLLTVGLLLFFFSDKGRLILEWNSYYWFVYCILAAPLLMFGWKLLHSNTDQEE